MRLYEFESPLALFEDISGEEMLQVFHTMHHDAGMNPDMDQYIMNHNWELRDFTPDMFPTEEEFFDYDDPFDRIVDIDYGHRVNIADPIIVGPQYSDGKYSVIDGNHRAAAAQRAGKTIKGYFPVEKVNEEAMKISDLTVSDAGMAIAQSAGGGSKTDKPVTVTKLPSGHVYLVNGYHRLVDAIKAGKDSIEVEFVPFEQVEILWNNEREADIKYGKRFDIEETGMIFARKKGKGGGVSTVQKFTCTSGPRAGKRVSSLAQCFSPIDVAKRVQMIKTRAKTATRQARRTKFTKRVDPSSLLTKILNKARRPAKPKKQSIVCQYVSAICCWVVCDFNYAVNTVASYVAQ